MRPRYDKTLAWQEIAAWHFEARTADGALTSRTTTASSATGQLWGALPTAARASAASPRVIGGRALNGGSPDAVRAALREDEAMSQLVLKRASGPQQIQ